MQRPHQKLINKWASNSDSLVYCHDKVNRNWNQVIQSPAWRESENYRVVLPGYQDAWEAFLAGTLQMKSRDGEWTDWDFSDGAPHFDKGVEYYRRKPDAIGATLLEEVVNKYSKSNLGPYTLSLIDKKNIKTSLLKIASQGHRYCALKDIVGDIPKHARYYEAVFNYLVNNGFGWGSVGPKLTYHRDLYIVIEGSL